MAPQPMLLLPLGVEARQTLPWQTGQSRESTASVFVSAPVAGTHSLGPGGLPGRLLSGTVCLWGDGCTGVRRERLG